jgi:hypothetical protein
MQDCALRDRLPLGFQSRMFQSRSRPTIDNDSDRSTPPHKTIEENWNRGIKFMLKSQMKAEQLVFYSTHLFSIHEIIHQE